MINPRQSVILANGYVATYLESKPARYSTTLIMVHGIRGSADGLADLIKPLSKKYRVIAPDLPAHSGSEPLPEASIAAYVDWIEAFTEATVTSGRIILVGHSFATLFCMEALDREGFSAAVLLNPVCPQVLSDKLVGFYYKIADVLPHKWQAGWLKLPPIESLTQYLLIHNRATANVAKVATLHRQESGVLQPLPIIRLMRSLWPWMRQVDFSKVEKPVTVIAGEKDQLSPLRHVKSFYSHLPDSQLIIVPKSGHLAHVDDLDSTVVAIEDSIKQIIKVSL